MHTVWSTACSFRCPGNYAWEMRCLRPTDLHAARDYRTRWSVGGRSVAMGRATAVGRSVSIVFGETGCPICRLGCCPVLATEPEGRLAAIVDFTFNLGAAADLDFAEAHQPAGLGCCCKRAAPLGLRWRQGAAGAGRASRSRSGFIAIELR